MDRLKSAGKSNFSKFSSFRLIVLLLQRCSSQHETQAKGGRCRTGGHASGQEDTPQDRKQACVVDRRDIADETSLLHKFNDDG